MKQPQGGVQYGQWIEFDFKSAAHNDNINSSVALDVTAAMLDELLIANEQTSFVRKGIPLVCNYKFIQHGGHGFVSPIPRGLGPRDCNPRISARISTQIVRKQIFSFYSVVRIAHDNFSEMSVNEGNLL